MVFLGLGLCMLSLLYAILISKGCILTPHSSDYNHVFSSCLSYWTHWCFMVDAYI